MAAPFVVSNPESSSTFPSNSKSSPSLDSSDASSDLKLSSSSSHEDNLFPDNAKANSQASADVIEDVLIKIPGAIVHLIDKQHGVELASGDLTIVRLRQGDKVVDVLARIGEDMQWPLAMDEATVKLDDSHYFFSLHVPTSQAPGSSDDESYESDNLLNYGLTIASKGQDKLLNEFDGILEQYSSFFVQNVSAKSKLLDGSAENEKKETMEDRSASYWTSLGPNVEDYSGCVARAIAAGSAQLIKGILLCSDVTVDRLKWGDEFLRERMDRCSNQLEVSPEALERIKRVKSISKMSEELATGILSGVVKVSGFLVCSVVNSDVGKKFFSLLLGEVVLASLDGFSKVCDAVEVAGRNVMSTSSVVTTRIVSHRYGEKAAGATNEGLDAAGHAIGTAWAVLELRKSLNPKNTIKRAKSAAQVDAAACRGEV